MDNNLSESDELFKKISSSESKDVFTLMNTRETGLTEKEAKDLLVKFGKNEIEEKKSESAFIKFIKNFTSIMAILLWIAGIVAFFWTDTPQLGIAIWMVNVINGLFSFFQENKASKATEALKKMLPSYARVIRDGQEKKILAEDLVPGDYILIEEGDKISADSRLIETTDLQVSQSALTGESNPVRKFNLPVINKDLANFEYKNMVFAGTTISSGSGKAIIVSTGMNTEFGKIAGLTQSMGDEKSPLQKELDKLTKQISVISVSIGIFFFVLAAVFVKTPMAEAFVFALGMVVAFIPEGLLPTVTLSLAIAVQRMAKEHALVKKLSSVETLGSTSVICSDKTGTLTQNEMTVSDLWLLKEELKVTGLGYSPKGDILKDNKKLTFKEKEDEDLHLLLAAASLCNNAKVLSPDEKHTNYTVLGDPTEACLRVAAEKAGINIELEEEEAKRIRELPFDSSRKRMAVINQLKKPMDGTKRVAFVKGAPKETVELCKYVIINGEKREIEQKDIDRIMKANDSYARNGLRVLAVAYRPLTDDLNLPSSLREYTPELIEEQMIFIGLIAMSDPPRVEVAAAVEKCHEADIRIIMITGDYGLTAESIAKRIGIVKKDNPRVVTGIELKTMTDEELKEALSDEVIFARVAPEQKYRVVSNLQELGKIVAVTGDGVNDSPALKKADIGIAMGITGTDVAKESADMILTDDNFASIVRAIEEGRAVYDNIRKFLVYIFNSNMAEAVPSVAFLLSRGLIPLPLTVMQILFIDLGTDLAPALGLGTELPEEGIMKRPPRKQSDSLLNKSIMVKAFLWYGLLAAIAAMAGYFFVNYTKGWPLVKLAASGIDYRQATTVALGAIIFCQIGAVMNCRTKNQSVFKIGLFSNKIVNIGILIEIVLFVSIAYIPIFHNLFNTAPLNIKEWVFLLICPVVIIAIEEIRKSMSRKKNK